jgi:bifunctional non-homologous end joining protein LigD
VAKQSSVVEIEGRQIKLSNLDKVLYPKTGFTKSQVIDYYIRIAPALLPHLEGRPVTLKRYPDGVEGMHFYEKNCPSYRPEWMKTAKVWSEGNNRYMYYCVASDLPSLVWLANLADLELHPSLSVAPDIKRPTVIAFDLDPGPPANIVECCQVGLWVKEIFAGLGMEAFAKTSGSKGLQVYVPLNTAITYDQTKPFAKAIARLLEERYPDRAVSDMKKSLRTNKVFVDWSQNDDYKTTICVYSLRAKEQPAVSTPVSWKEVQNCLKSGDPEQLVFVSDQVLKRVEKMGDLFEPVLKLKQKLPGIADLEKTRQRSGSWTRPRGQTTPGEHGEEKVEIKIEVRNPRWVSQTEAPNGSRPRIAAMTSAQLFDHGGTTPVMRAYAISCPMCSLA